MYCILSQFYKEIISVKKWSVELESVIGAIWIKVSELKFTQNRVDIKTKNLIEWIFNIKKNYQEHLYGHRF